MRRRFLLCAVRPALHVTLRDKCPEKHGFFQAVINHPFEL